MDVVEFLRLCARTTERPAPRVGPRYREMILVAHRAGARDIAVPDLVGALSEEDVAITAADAEDPRRLMSTWERRRPTWRRSGPPTDTGGAGP